MKKSDVKPGAAPAPPGDGEFSLIPNNKLLDLYAAMIKCRLIADGIANITADRRKRALLKSAAVTAGVTIDLRASDAIGPVPFDLTPCVLKGVALKSLLRWWANPSTRFPRVIARSNVIPPAASDAPRLEAALRLAARFRSTNSGSVVVFFAGPDTLRSKPAASSLFSRELLESFLSQAAAERLPILFVLQSDGNADDYIPISKQCGLPCMVVDRDDVVAVYRVASEALTHARRGNGPTLIDSKPWRLNGRGRKTSELHNSIGKMELYLAGKGLAYRSVKDKVIKKFAAEVVRAKNAFAGMEKT
jgi:Dehydrogenase E1 component